jgi:tRNA (guanine-N7-)-methyltransferase
MIVRALGGIVRTARTSPVPIIIACLASKPEPTLQPGHQGGRSIGQKRVRQHVNPLRSSHQYLVDLPAHWPETLFADGSKPLHIDLGCARGNFCLDLAPLVPQVNILGIEIRKALVDAATGDATRDGLQNLAFLACNANVNLRHVLELAKPSCKLQSISIQFPDPWFKVKHHKRRVVQPDLVRALTDYLEPGGWLWLQTDVHELAIDIRDVVLSTEPTRLQLADGGEDTWQPTRPAMLTEVTTERERASAALDRPVYRCLFVRSDDPKSE